MRTSLSNFGRKFIFIPILTIWIFRKTLTALICGRRLDIFKSPQNVEPKWGLVVLSPALLVILEEFEKIMWSLFWQWRVFNP